MKRIWFGNTLFADYSQDMVWSSEEPLVSDLLNTLTQLDRGEVSPSDGHPREVVFNRIVKDVKPVRVEQDQSRQIELDEEVVF